MLFLFISPTNITISQPQPATSLLPDAMLYTMYSAACLPMAHSFVASSSNVWHLIDHYIVWRHYCIVTPVGCVSMTCSLLRYYYTNCGVLASRHTLRPSLIYWHYTLLQQFRTNNDARRRLRAINAVTATPYYHRKTTLKVVKVTRGLLRSGRDLLAMSISTYLDDLWSRRKDGGGWSGVGDGPDWIPDHSRT